MNKKNILKNKLLDLIKVFTIFCVVSFQSPAVAIGSWQDMTYITGINPAIDLEVRSSDITVEPNSQGALRAKVRLNLAAFPEINNLAIGELKTMRIVATKKASSPNGIDIPSGSKVFTVFKLLPSLTYHFPLSDFSSKNEKYEFCVFNIENEHVATFHQTFTAGNGVSIEAPENFETTMSEEDAIQAKQAANFFTKFFTVKDDDEVTEPELQYIANGAFELVIPSGGSGGSSDDADSLTKGTVNDARLSSNVVLETATQTLTNKTLTSPNITAPTMTGLITAATIKLTGGSPGAGKVLTSDASGNASWQDAASGGGGLTTGSSPSSSCASANAGDLYMDTDTGLTYICDKSNSRNKWLSLQDNTFTGEETSSCYSGDTVSDGTCNVDFGDAVPYNVGLYLAHPITITGFGYSSQSDYCTSGSFDVEVWGTGSNSENESISHKVTVASGLNNKAHNSKTLNLDLDGNQYIKWGLDNNCGQTIADFNIILYYRLRHD